MLRKVDVGEYPLDLVPLDKDVLSLELDGLFRRVGFCLDLPLLRACVSVSVCFLLCGRLSVCVCVRVSMPSAERTGISHAAVV